MNIAESHSGSPAEEQKAVHYVEPIVQSGTGRATLNEAFVRRSRYHEVGYCKAVVNFTSFPEKGDEFILKEDGKQIFRGRIKSVDELRNEAYLVRANDIMKKIKNMKVTGNYEGSIGDIVEDILREKDIQSVVHQRGGCNLESKKQWSDARLDSVLDHLAKASAAFWWIDEFNGLHFGPEPQIADHDIEHVLESSAGESDKSVKEAKARGDSPASEKAKELMHQINKHGLSSDKSAEGEGGDKLYKDKNLRQQAEADNAAESIMWESLSQTKNGWIKAVGMPQIEPYDRIHLPEWFEGQDYTVSTIEHRIDNDVGFETKIWVCASPDGDAQPIETNGISPVAPEPESGSLTGGFSE